MTSDLLRVIAELRARATKCYRDCEMLDLREAPFTSGWKTGAGYAFGEAALALEELVKLEAVNG